MDESGVADRKVRAATAAFVLISASQPEAVNAMTRYFEELDARFDGGFDPGDTLIADASSMDAPTGAFVVVRVDGEVVACGGVKQHAASVAEIKRMWVAPDWRGVGIGARLLASLEAQARRLGNQSVVLDTNSVLLEAIAMYERSGYQAIERYNDNPYARHWFRKNLDIQNDGWSPRGESNS